MRALFYHPTPDWTGCARAFAVAARGLAARGYQVTYACAEEGTALQRASAPGVDVLTLPVDETWVTASRRLRQAIIDGFVEVVFVHGEREQLVAASAVWQASRGAVVRRVGAGQRLTLGRSGRNALRMAATGFLGTSADQAEALDPRLAALGVIVADLGIDGAEADAVAAPRDAGQKGGNVGGNGTRAGGAQSIVCVFDPTAKVQAAAVLRAVAMLAPRHPDLRVSLVGAGSDDEALRMHAAALGIHRVVAHLGERDDQGALLAGADLGWVVADGDDGAFGALDFMARRVPVLVQRDTVPARYVADGITGVHLSPGDVAGTAAIVASLLAHADERRAMGNAGRARVDRAFTEAAMLDGFVRAADAARDRSRWRA